MTANQYVTFQKFDDKFAVLELAELLKQADIDFIIEDTSLSFDPSFANSELIKEYRIKLKKENFERADNYLLQITEKLLQDVDSDHYLFNFTDEELIEIITKPDEWSKFDYLLAQKILKERGKEITPEIVQVIKKQRLQELAKPDESQRTWIIGGYLFSFMGGLLGAFIGYHLRYQNKTTTPAIIWK